MSMRDALRLCPHAICVRPRMTRYQQVSEQVFTIFREFTPLVEGLSLDEAFLDVSRSERLLGNGLQIGRDIRQRIFTQTQLTASVGIAPNKLLAKIASDLNKPDGLCRIGPENLHEVIDRLPIQKLRGVGQKSLPAVHTAGILTFRDLQRASEEVLWRAFGKAGKAMQALAMGVDERPVVADRDEKSISAEETFAADIENAAELTAELTKLADRAAGRLRAHGLSAARVTVKIRRADFKTFTRQRCLEPPTQDTAAVAALAKRLLGEWREIHRDAAVRLLGVGVGDLQAVRQADLFVAGAPRNSRLDTTVDDIRHRFGPGLLTRASLLPRRPGGAGSRDH
jgi:DNA polymerase-4